jgi:hypothetical protein
MLVQITVKIDGGEVGTVERELSGSAAEMEEALRETEQRSGRMVMERVLRQMACQVRAPRCCGRTMKNCGRRLRVRSRFTTRA